MRVWLQALPSALLPREDMGPLRRVHCGGGGGRLHHRCKGWVHCMERLAPLMGAGLSIMAVPARRGACIACRGVNLQPPWRLLARLHHSVHASVFQPSCMWPPWVLCRQAAGLQPGAVPGAECGGQPRHHRRHALSARQDPEGLQEPDRLSPSAAWAAKDSPVASCQLRTPRQARFVPPFIFSPGALEVAPANPNNAIR